MDAASSFRSASVRERAWSVAKTRVVPPTRSSVAATVATITSTRRRVMVEAQPAGQGVRDV